MKNEQQRLALEFLINGYIEEPEKVAQAFLKFLDDRQEELLENHSWLTFLEEVQRGSQVNLFAYREAMKRCQTQAH